MQGTLRVLVTGYCLGVAAGRLHLGFIDPLVSFLLSSREPDDAQIAFVANLMAYGLIVIGVVTLLRPIHLLTLLVLIHAVGTAVAGMFLTEGLWANWVPALQATSYIVPLALLLLDFWPPKIKATLVICLSAVSLLRLAAVATFFAQAVICVDQCQHGGNWAELLQTAARNGFHRELTAAQSQQVLGAIGLIHLGVAASLLTSRQASVAWLAVLWGVLWTMLPIFAEGKHGYDETLIRVSEWGAPLVVALFQSLSIRKQQTKYVAESESNSPRKAG